MCLCDNLIGIKNRHAILRRFIINLHVGKLNIHPIRIARSTKSNTPRFLNLIQRPRIIYSITLPPHPNTPIHP